MLGCARLHKPIITTQLIWLICAFYVYVLSLYFVYFLYNFERFMFFCTSFLLAFNGIWIRCLQFPGEQTDIFRYLSISEILHKAQYRKIAITIFLSMTVKVFCPWYIWQHMTIAGLCFIGSIAVFVLLPMNTSSNSGIRGKGTKI